MKKFMMGILTGVVVIPILADCVELVDMWFEAAKIAPSMKVTRGNGEIQKLAREYDLDGEGDEDVQSIGFEVPTEADYEEEEDDGYAE